MSVKKDASGRRSVEVEVEVPDTPEEVWQAIATGPGVSSWFVPTEERQDGTVQEVLQDTEKSFAQFRAMRQEAQHLREQERTRISGLYRCPHKSDLSLSEAHRRDASPPHQLPSLLQATEGNPGTRQEDRINPQLMAPGLHSEPTETRTRSGPLRLALRRPHSTS